MTAQSKSDTFFRNLYDLISERRPFLFGLIGLALATSGVLIARVQLDMSFNPFFSDDKQTTATTADLETIFGQRLGAYFGVIIENDDILSEGFLRRLESATTLIEQLDHIEEVISLIRFPYPQWTQEGVKTDWLLSIGETNEPIPESRLEAVRQNATLRGLILSEDGKSTLILARPDVLRSDLTGRARVIDEFKATVENTLSEQSTLHYIGYSVVEDAFADIVLRGLAQTFVLTFLTLMIFLWIIYKRVAFVLAALSGVVFAIPVSVGMMVLLGQDVTMINSLVPVVILIIGVADAVHMIQSYLVHHRKALRNAPSKASGKTPKSDAIRNMFVEMGLPCLLTTVTTAGGFLGLCIAEITAIRDFGLNVSIGIVSVYVFNLVTLPSILAWSSNAQTETKTQIAAWVEKWASVSANSVIRWSRLVTAGFAIFFVATVVSLPELEINQRVNGEVSPDTAIRADQDLLEAEYGGYLGPDLAIRRRDGRTLASTSDVTRIRDFSAAVAALSDVDRVENFTDFLPPIGTSHAASSGLSTLLNDDKLGLRLRDLINDDLDHAIVSVYVSDVGTKRALELVSEVETLAEAHLGSAYETQIFGQWWLAQQGMQNMSRDMLLSFLTSLLLILPLLALALRNVRLFLVSLLPNLLPMVFALAFAIWLGIPIRIGTAMVLAIALGIAVDDTIHMMMRLKRELLVQKNEYEAVRASLKHTGAAVLFTTAILVMGFVTMLSNELLAIQDMGILAAGTLFVAFLCDVYLAPALFLITRPRSSRLAPSFSPVRLGRSIRSSSGEPRRFIANNLSTGNQLNTLNREGDR